MDKSVYHHEIPNKIQKECSINRSWRETKKENKVQFTQHV